jgi:hypothetical protein
VRNFPEERGTNMYLCRNGKMSSELMEIFPTKLTSVLLLIKGSVLFFLVKHTVLRSDEYPNQEFDA